MNTRSVLILGANGRLGLAAAQAFHRAGWRVLAQTRRPFAAAMPAGAVPLHGSLDDPRHADALLREAAEASVVVYAVNPLYTRWDAEMLPLARAGMALAQRLGATFMLPGNVYNFGAGMPALLHEGTPERPTTQKGRLRCAFEAELAARSRSGRNRSGVALRSIVVRAGDFYGGGPGNWFDRAIVKSLTAGKLVYPGPLDVMHAWAYLPDFADCLVALAAAHDRLGEFERFHFPGHALTGGELLQAIEQAAASLGLAPARGVFKRGVLPWGAMRALAWAVPTWRELLTMAYLWRVPHQLDGGRLAQVIGTIPTTPLADALRASLQPGAPSFRRPPRSTPAAGGQTRPGASPTPQIAPTLPVTGSTTPVM